MNEYPDTHYDKFNPEIEDKNAEYYYCDTCDLNKAVNDGLCKECSEELEKDQQIEWLKKQVETVQAQADRYKALYQKSDKLIDNIASLIHDYLNE